MPIYSDELNAYGPGNYYGRSPAVLPMSSAPIPQSYPASQAPSNMGTIYSDELGYYGQPTGARPMSSAPVEQPLTQGPYSYNPETQRLIQRSIVSRTPIIDRMPAQFTPVSNPINANAAYPKKKNDFTPTDYAQFWKSGVEVPKAQDVGGYINNALYGQDLFESRINIPINMPIRTEINTGILNALTRRMLQYGNASNFNSDQLARY